VSQMKRAYEDFVDDTLRYWFPDGMNDLSQEEKERWEAKAEEVVSSLLDSHGVKEVLLEVRDRGFADGISTDGA
jgi:hypothetical protein